MSTTRLWPLLLLAACSHGSISADAGDWPAPDLGDAILPQGPGTVGSATVRVHYPSWTGTMDIVFPTDAHAVAMQCKIVAPDECDAQVVFTHAKTVALRPRLAGVEARGALWIVGGGETIDVYPHFSQKQGQLLTLLPAFHSAALEPFEPSNARIIQVYLPASYAENTTARYPVIYMHDGRNLFDAAIEPNHIEWQVDETLEDAWEHTGRIAELIVVAIDEFVTVSGTLQNRRQGEYNPTPTDLALPHCGDAYVQMIATELKPQIDAALRTRPGREDTALGGSSIGMSISAWAVLKYPNVFSRYIGLSPASGIDFNYLAAQIAATPSTNARLRKIYLDIGTYEGDVMSPFATAYRGLGYTDGVELLTLYEIDGLHDEYAWARRLPAAFAFVFPDRRSP